MKPWQMEQRTKTCGPIPGFILTHNHWPFQSSDSSATHAFLRSRPVANGVCFRGRPLLDGKEREPAHVHFLRETPLGCRRNPKGKPLTCWRDRQGMRNGMNSPKNPPFPMVSFIRESPQTGSFNHRDPTNFAPIASSGPGEALVPDAVSFTAAMSASASEAI